MSPAFKFDHAGRIRPECAAAFHRHFPELAPGYESDEPGYCPACEGSGEGRTDGSVCWKCSGTGER